METTNKLLNEALRLLRVFSDKKSKDLAVLLGISPSYLSEIESGKKEPSIAIINKYAEVFNTKPSVILFFSESLYDKTQGNTIKEFLARNAVAFLQKIESYNSDFHNDKQPTL